MKFIQKAAAFYCRHWVLLSSIIVIIILRALLLQFTPPGFYLDEAAGGAHVIALLTQGTNAHGEAWPLFSASLGGGYTTPIYLYPLAAWALLFGVSEYSLRAFSLFVTVITAALIALTIRLWLDNKAALIGALTALVLPWGWVQGSIAWDPALVPLFVALSLFGFSAALKTNSNLYQLISIIATGISLIILAYLYPPCRVTAPLLLAFYYGILLYRKKLSIKTALILSAVFAALCIPLLQFMLQPDALQRSSELSVFYGVSLFAGVWQIFLNFVQILNPIFLFITGDANMRHSTGQQGMLGLASVPAIIALIYGGIRLMRRYKRKQKWTITSSVWLVAVSFIGIIFSILGSALTAEGQPHSLRAAAAWPFFVVIITIGWTYLIARTSRAIQILAITFSVVATGWYVNDLAMHYPARSAEAFDVSIRQTIDRQQLPANYPSLSLYYYSHK